MGQKVWTYSLNILVAISMVSACAPKSRLPEIDRNGKVKTEDKAGELGGRGQKDPTPSLNIPRVSSSAPGTEQDKAVANALIDKANLEMVQDFEVGDGEIKEVKIGTHAFKLTDGNLFLIDKDEKAKVVLGGRILEAGNHVLALHIFIEIAGQQHMLVSLEKTGLERLKPVFMTIVDKKLPEGPRNEVKEKVGKISKMEVLRRYEPINPKDQQTIDRIEKGDCVLVNISNGSGQLCMTTQRYVLKSDDEKTIILKSNLSNIEDFAVEHSESLPILNPDVDEADSGRFIRVMLEIANVLLDDAADDTVLKFELSFTNNKVSKRAKEVIARGVEEEKTQAAAQEAAAKAEADARDKVHAAEESDIAASVNKTAAAPITPPPPAPTATPAEVPAPAPEEVTPEVVSIRVRPLNDLVAPIPTPKPKDPILITGNGAGPRSGCEIKDQIEALGPQPTVLRIQAVVYKRSYYHCTDEELVTVKTIADQNLKLYGSSTSSGTMGFNLRQRFEDIKQKVEAEIKTRNM